ncbi:MAG: class I SAM-dependent methyltransferase [Bdellovibrionales bacterium]
MLSRAMQKIDKYDFYFRAVQCPASEIDFVTKAYSKIKGSKPKVLREDFCGTFALCCEWVKRSVENSAYGIDLDEEPLAYGRAHYLSRLKCEQQNRVHILQKDVCGSDLPASDLIVSLNFSYFAFKTRSQLLDYFSKCRKTLGKKGMLFLDCLGGPGTQAAHEDKVDNGDFTYYWEQVHFDALKNEALFYIHFRPRNGSKMNKVFTYDWRIWSPIEIKEILQEAGFRKIVFYWEGSDDQGEGNGIFKPAEKSLEELDRWVIYIGAES